jgi:hypothetical protein
MGTFVKTPQGGGNVGFLGLGVLDVLVFYFLPIPKISEFS